MALRVWLPLNGNLNNQGLGTLDSSFTATNYVWETGKTGNNLHLSNTATNTVTIEELKEVKTLTCSFWFQIHDKENITGFSDILDLGVEKISTGATTNFRLEVNSVKTAVGLWGNGVVTNSSGIGCFGIEDDIWYHITFSTDGETVWVYQNGTLVTTHLTGSDYRNDYRFLGTVRMGDTGNMNVTLADVRIYDECLSPKQIKEISRGLIAHYKLSGPESNPNLLVNTKTLLSPSGTNGTRLDNYFEGFAANYLKYEGTSYKDAYSITSVVSPIAGEKYTLTFYAKGNCNIVCFFYPNTCSYGISSQGRTTTAADGAITFNLSESWTKYWVTWTVSSSLVEGNKNIVAGRIQNQGEGAECYISKLKFEKGDASTPWIPNVIDKEYTGLGYDKIETTDVSGNGYNATRIGTLTFDSDSPRYRGSAICSTGVDGLKTDLSIPEMTELTVSFWVKPSASSGGYCAIMCTYNQPAGTTSGLWIAVNCEGRKVWAYKGAYETVSGTLTNGTWYHCVYTFNNGTSKWYINGVEQTLAQDTYSGTTIPLLNMSIGNTYPGSQWNTKNYGGLSDFRIYSTALSSSDIKELYQSAAIISNKGDTYAYEFYEDGELLAYANGPAGHSDYNGTYVQTIVDDPDSPTGKATELECTVAGRGYYIGGGTIPWSTAKSQMVHGQTYVLSMYMKSSREKTMNMNVECASSQSRNNWTVGTEYKHLVNTFVYNADVTYSAITNYSDFEVGDKVWIHSIKIEEAKSQPSISKTGVFQSNTYDENETAKIYTSKTEANNFIEI